MYSTMHGLAGRNLFISSLIFPPPPKNKIKKGQAVPLGLAFDSFFAFCSNFAFFFCSSFFTSFFLFKVLISSSVFATGLKNPSRRACCAVFIFFVSLAAALRTRSSLKPFSVTRNCTKPSTSGASHLKSQSGCSGGRTSGWRNSSRASW